MKRKILIFTLCAALLLCVPVSADGAAGDAVDSESVLLSAGTLLTRNTYWTGSDYRTEHYMECTPDALLRPTAYSRETLCSAVSLRGAAAELASQGIHAAAGVNGGFYNISSYVPVGMVVQSGALRSSDEGLYAVGFRTDGSAVLGRPALSMTLTAEERSWPLDAVNKSGGSGVTLYTEDFAAAVKTSKCYIAVCAIGGPIPLSGSVSLTVEEISGPTERFEAAEGRAVLCFPETGEEELPALLTALKPGMELTLTVECAEGWEDVDSAVGILYKLVTDGSAEPGLDRTAAPRSAVGLKADGTLVLYTVDGRQSGWSVGMGLNAVASRMIELGCVEAGTLDGGGSTNLSAVLPGDAAFSQINRPSDGSARSVVNYIFLTTQSEPTGEGVRLALSPLDIDAMPGAETALTVKAADDCGYPAALPEEVSFTVSGGVGRVENGVFYAENPGTGVITASAPGAESVSIPVTVVAEPDELALYGEVYGKLTTSLSLEPEQEVDLTVRAKCGHVLLETSDESFLWTLDAEAGAVDETGHLTPSPVSGGGMLTVSAGEASVSIPIRVTAAIPFRDVKKGDACYDAVKYVYDHQIFNGTGDTQFEPETVMSRGMIVTVLWRISGQPEAASQPGFADVAAEDWYGPAVAWAAENGIVNGYSETQFAPLEDLTKEQILAILYRWAGEPETENTELDCTDAGDADDWARSALLWACSGKLHLVDTDGNGALLPREPMCRAAVAEVLMRFLTAEN